MPVWLKPKLLFVAWALLILVSIALFGDGVSGGDEGSLLRYAKLFRSSDFNWQEFLAELGNKLGYVQHHLAWFFLMLAEVWTSQQFIMPMMTKIAPGLSPELVEDFILSYVQTIFIWLAVVIGYAWLRKTQLSSLISLLTVFLFWAGSYSISFLASGVIENLLALLIVMRFLISETSKPFGKMRIVVLASIDVLLLTLKLYTGLLVVILLCYDYLWRQKNYRDLVLHIILISVCLAVFFAFKQSLPNTILPKYYYDPDDMFFGLYLQRFSAAIVSFPYGLLWCLPALLLVFWGVRDKYLFICKSGIVIGILLYFAFYKFWEGATGIAGPRYIFPFLLCFLPEIGRGLERFLNWKKATVFIIPALVLVFWPSLEYRQNIVFHHLHGRLFFPHEKVISDGWLWMTEHDGIPLYNPLYHPAISAWRIMLAKQTGAELVHFPLDKDYSIASNAILPSTLPARLRYLSSIAESETPLPIIKRYHKTLQNIPSFWLTLLSSGIYLPGLWFVILLISCWRYYRNRAY